MTSACPSCRPSGSNTIRATMSIVLPALNGMITRIGLAGQLCAQLTRGSAGVMAAAAMSCRWRRRVCFEDVPSLIRYAARAFCLIQLACYLKNITIDRGLKTQLLTLGHLDNLIRASPTH